MYSGERSTLTVALGNWLVRGGGVADFGKEDVEDVGRRLEQRADAEAAEHQRGELAAALAGHQHLGAGGAFRVGQHAVLLDDQRAPQRHHHQHAEDAAGERQHRDLRVVEILRSFRHQEDQRRDREDHAAGHRFAGRADGLDDVVFEDRRAAQSLQHRDGEHGDRNRRADGEAGSAGPRYTVEAPNNSPNRTPRMMALAVNSAMFSLGGDVGLKTFRGICHDADDTSALKLRYSEICL